MKKIFEYFGLICLICFSFFITEKTTLVVQEVDEIMIKIKEDMNNYTTKGVDAKIVDDTIIPGLTGKAINVEKSYKNMKGKGVYDSSFYIYDALVPTISLEDNLDKYIKELVEARKKLLEHSILIDDAYQGNDADLIKEKYAERLETLNKVIMNYFDYTNYLKKVSGVYKDNIICVRKNLIAVLESSPLDTIDNHQLSFDSAINNDYLEEV